MGFPSPQEMLGISLALIAGLLLAIGAQFQHRGVSAVQARTTNVPRSVLVRLSNLLRQPSWLAGTLIICLAITFQLCGLYLAPISVVQPLGVSGLVFASVLNVKVSRISLGGPARWAVALCCVGVTIFVIIAALVTRPRPASAIEAYEIVGLVAAVLAVIAGAYAVFRETLKPMFFVVGAGALFGLVVTLAKISMDRVGALMQSDEPPSAAAVLPIVLSVAGLSTAALVGSALVQRAYAQSTPDVVMAGLTVIDPIVAVTVGALVLHEFTSAQPWVVLLSMGAAAIAIVGVCRLAVTHPSAKTQRIAPLLRDQLSQ